MCVSAVHNTFRGIFARDVNATVKLCQKNKNLVTVSDQALRNDRGYVILQMAAIMADVSSEPNAKIRNPTSSILNFNNHLAKFQDIYALGLVT